MVLLIHRARDYYQRIADRKQITIHAESTVPSALIWTDSVAVAAVLDNLLSNAVKYSPPGKDVWIRIAMDQNAVVCDVQDERARSEPARSGSAFSKRRPAQPSRPTGGESSTGYGLAVAKELITKLGGTISCDSSLGKGACFSIRLPISRQTAGGAAPPP